MQSRTPKSTWNSASQIPPMMIQMMFRTPLEKRWPSPSRSSRPKGHIT